MARACGPSSASGRLRCTRWPRSHWTMAGGAEPVGYVDQQAQVDAVAADEGDGFEHVAAGGALAGERLGESRQMREKEGDQRSGHQFGHSAPFAGAAVEGAVVVALDEGDVVPGQERARAGPVRTRGRSPGCRRRRTRSRSPVVTCTAFHMAWPLPCSVPYSGRMLAGGHDVGAGRRRRPRRCHRWSRRRSRPARRPRGGVHQLARGWRDRSGRWWPPRPGREADRDPAAPLGRHERGTAGKSSMVEDERRIAAAMPRTAAGGPSAEPGIDVATDGHSCGIIKSG